MKCTIARQYVHAELDGELTARQQVALDEHLHTCEACRAVRSQLMLIRSTMGRLAKASEPEGTPLAPIAFSPVRGSLRLTVPTWIWAAAAVFVLCFGGWLAKDLVQPTTVRPDAVALKSDQPIEPPIVAEVPQPALRERPTVAVEALPDTLVVPCESKNPRVTVFWLYKLTATAENSEPADRETRRPM